MTARGDAQLGIERQREHFNGIAERYREGRRQHTHRLLKSLIWSEAFARIEEFRAGKIRVLEPMCGYGEGFGIVAANLNPNIEYVGFDYSDHVVDWLKKEQPDWNVCFADVTQYAPAENSTDVIILIGGLHHVPNAAGDVVARLARALRPGGLFINFEPTNGNAVFKAVRDAIYRRNKIFDEATERAFSVEELEGFFLNAGLERGFVFYPGLSAYVLYYNPYAFPWLNVGGEFGVRAAFAIDKLFYRNLIGRFFSFATLSVWKAPGETKTPPASAASAEFP